MKCKCGKDALPKIRFCTDCKRRYIQEMKDSGYLQKTNNFHCGDNRLKESKENTYETKHGTGH